MRVSDGRSSIFCIRDLGSSTKRRTSMSMVACDHTESSVGYIEEDHDRKGGARRAYGSSPWGFTGRAGRLPPVVARRFDWKNPEAPEHVLEIGGVDLVD